MADASIRIDTKVDNSNLLELRKDLEKLENKLENLHKKGAKLEALGVDKQSRQWQGLIYEIAQVEGDLYDVEERMKAITQLNTNKTANGFEKIHNSCTGLFNVIKDGTKKANGLFATMTSRLKGIALSLLVFNWITKGFNAMVSAMKDGFRNLAQYSADYNKAMSGLKSECAELKNSLAVAFEPVATAIIPYITQLISWLNTAANSVSRFLAVISGKNTYTRAKKQVVDYAKSLKSASDSAKGALAAFDSINVLSKNGSGGAGGEATGADAFETVNVTEEDYAWLDMVKDKLHEILGILIGIGFAMAVFGVGGRVLAFVAVLTLILGLLEFIVSYMDAWSNGISFDNLHGMLQGLLAIFLAIWVLFGPFAAGLALIAGGIALVVLAIKDMLENGINTQNCFALLIGVVAALVGIFMAFGSTAAMVVGGIVAVIGIFAALIAVAGNGEEAIATLKSMCQNFADFFKKIFAGDIEGAMESLKLAGKDFVNVIIIAFESLVNCIIMGLNWLIEKINSISFEVPDWVPVIGGKTLSPDIPAIKEVSLPRLATGGIVDRPTRAIFGEAGREAVLPLENNTGWMDDLADKLAARMPVGNSGPIYMQIDGKTFARLEMPYLKQENGRVGVSFKMGDAL